MIRYTPVALALLVPVSCYADSVNDRIVKFCQQNLGKQVGDGQCYALAAEALSAVEARPQSEYGDDPGKGDYIWGKLIAYYEMTPTGPKQTGKSTDVRPGDIIQFRDTKWKGSATYDHHTAVVSALKNGGTVIEVFHQNVSGKKTVVTGSLNFYRLKSGWIRVYQPQAKQ